MCEDDGGLMTNENEIEEKKRFSLMDLDNTGSITWNEFVDFETANLLSKKNKVNFKCSFLKFLFFNLLDSFLNKG